MYAANKIISFSGDATGIPKSQNLWYNLKAGQDKAECQKKLGVHFGRNYNASAKAAVRLSGIRITASTHCEVVVNMTYCGDKKK